jgi:hypothetical protein
MSIGAVLDEAWTIYTKFFTRFFVLAAIVFLAVNLLLALTATLDGGASGAVGLLLLGIAASLVASYWLQGALVHAVVDARDGRFDASIGDVYRAALPFLGTLIGAGLVAGLGIAAGLIAFVVPGLWLLTIWAVVAPVIVLEGSGVLASLGRSRELVRGHGWTMFGLIVVTLIVSWAAAGLLSAAFGFLGAFGQTLVGGTIASAVAAPFLATVVTIAYLRLREEKEGAAPTGASPHDRALGAPVVHPDATDPEEPRS